MAEPLQHPARAVHVSSLGFTETEKKQSSQKSALCLLSAYRLRVRLVGERWRPSLGSPLIPKAVSCDPWSQLLALTQLGCSALALLCRGRLLSQAAPPWPQHRGGPAGPGRRKILHAPHPPARAPASTVPHRRFLDTFTAPGLTDAVLCEHSSRRWHCHPACAEKPSPLVSSSTARILTRHASPRFPATPVSKQYHLALFLP